MAAKKKSQPKVKIPQWKTVSTRTDIKYDTVSLSELKEWIKESVPAGTPDEEIRLSFDIDDTRGYYDDVIIEASMELQVLEK